MQTHSEKLWQAIEAKQHSTILEILEANPNEDLVNSINPKSGRSLAMHVVSVKDMKKPEILSCVLLHPKVNLNYTNPHNGSTVFNALIDFICPEAVRLLKDNPEIILYGDKLSYEKANELKIANEKALNEEKASPDRDEPTVKYYELRVKNLKEILSMLRDITILHAIAKDDAGLMKRLKDAGCDVSDCLGDLGNKKFPTFLLKPNGNIRKLFNESKAESFNKLSLSMNTFFTKVDKIKQLDQEASEVIKKSNEEKVNVFKRAGDALKKIFK